MVTWFQMQEFSTPTGNMRPYAKALTFDQFVDMYGNAFDWGHVDQVSLGTYAICGGHPTLCCGQEIYYQRPKRKTTHLRDLVDICAKELAQMSIEEKELSYFVLEWEPESEHGRSVVLKIRE